MFEIRRHLEKTEKLTKINIKRYLGKKRLKIGPLKLSHKISNIILHNLGNFKRSTLILAKVIIFGP